MRFFHLWAVSVGLAAAIPTTATVEVRAESVQVAGDSAVRVARDASGSHAGERLEIRGKHDKSSKSKKVTPRDYVDNLDPNSLEISWGANGKLSRFHGDGKSMTSGRFHLEGADYGNYFLVVLFDKTAVVKKGKKKSHGEIWSKKFSYEPDSSHVIAALNQEIR